MARPANRDTLSGPRSYGGMLLSALCPGKKTPCCVAASRRHHVRALRTGSTRKGTFAGAFLRPIAMYKSFSVMMTHRHRAIGEGAARHSGCCDRLDLQQPCGIEYARDDDGQCWRTVSQNPFAHGSILIAEPAIGKESRDFHQIVEGHIGGSKRYLHVSPNEPGLIRKRLRNLALDINGNLPADVERATCVSDLDRLRVSRLG